MPWIIFCERPLLEEIKKKVVKPLTGLRVVCYYGCLTVRLLSDRHPGITRTLNIGPLNQNIGAEPIPGPIKRIAVAQVSS